MDRFFFFGGTEPSIIPEKSSQVAQHKCLAWSGHTGPVGKEGLAWWWGVHDSGGLKSWIGCSLCGVWPSEGKHWACEGGGSTELGGGQGGRGGPVSIWGGGVWGLGSGWRAQGFGVERWGLEAPGSG